MNEEEVKPSVILNPPGMSMEEFQPNAEEIIESRNNVCICGQPKSAHREREAVQCEKAFGL